MSEKKGLWYNIHKKRARIKGGSAEKMREPGSKGAPTDADFKSASESMMTTTADSGIPQDTKNMGPRLKSTVMHDRRRRKDAIPVLLKRFRKYIEDKNIG